MTTSATAFVAAAMNAVSGVGAPSYTSGVHMWNGAAEALNASPAMIMARPKTSSASCSWPAAAIPAKSIAPVAP